MDKQNDSPSDEEEWIKIRLQQDDTLIIGCIHRIPNTLEIPSPLENNDRLNESITTQQAH